MTLRDVCFEVGNALTHASIEAVLSGGSAATIYAPGAVSSQDADFILSFSSDARDAGRVLVELGYRFTNGMFAHEMHPFTVEFPPGPLAIGATREPIEIVTLSEGARRLRILSATDCVKDRLAAYYAWNDFNSRAQAIEVARAQAGILDLARIETWSAAEHAADSSQRALQKFTDFLRLLNT